jgi:hypothetical protein
VSDVPIVATFVSADTFRVATDLRSLVGVGHTVKCLLGTTSATAYVKSLSYSAPNTDVVIFFLVGIGALDGTLTEVNFSQYVPKFEELQSYPVATPLPAFVNTYPFHGGWVQAVCYADNKVPWVMPDTTYRAFLSCWAEGGRPAAVPLCMTQSVTKTTTRVTFTLLDPDTTGIPHYEVWIWRD